MEDIQLLSKVLESGNIDVITHNGLNSDYFPNYNEEFKFIVNHYKQYGKVPDKETFLTQFPDFTIIKCQESDAYLLDKLNEQYLFNRLAPVLKKVEELINTDSRKTIEYLQQEIPFLTSNLRLEAKDIVKDADERIAELERRKDGKFFITTGFKELDNALMGWQRGEDLVTIIGRVNEGKSWTLLKFLEEAWKAGYRVGLYSGEMSSIQMGFRFDTIYNNFSNFTLTRGNQDIESYKKYIEELKSKNSFFIVTPEDLGGNCTVSKLEAFIQKYKLDILGVDQYSLMEDEEAKPNQPLRTKYDNISKGLFLLSCKYHIPILAAVQANRNAVLNTNGKKKEEGPKLEHISESDAIAHNSSRVIAMRQNDGKLEFEIVKNRIGGRNGKYLYRWLIDTGKFEYVPTLANNDTEQVEHIKKQFRDKEDVF